MNLVFLYSARGRVPIDKLDKFPDAKLPSDSYINDVPTNTHVKGTLSDLYPYIWENLLKRKIFNKITTIFETSDGWGTTFYNNNLSNKFCFIPHISEVHKFIEPGDLIFVRGAWLWWRKDLNILMQKHHVVYYKGGRKIFKHWKWSVVLDDIFSDNYVDKYKHANIFYPKCINEEIFYPKPSLKKQYDIIVVGDIKRTKGQWRIVEVLNQYKNLYGTAPSVCLVGKMVHPSQYIKTKRKYKIHGIAYKGVVSREKLCNYYNTSKLYMHLGTNEQGPRTTLEAFRCGLPTLISDLPAMWPQWQRESASCRPVDCSNYKQAAKVMHEMLNTQYDPFVISEVYNKYAGIEQTCAMWLKLMRIARKYPKPGPQIFINKYI